jgi:hypothetical protein
MDCVHPTTLGYKTIAEIVKGKLFETVKTKDDKGKEVDTV